MRLRDEDNETVRLVPISEPIDVPNFKGRYHLVLQHPIFFCECARLARKQYKAQPVLFMTRQDWEQISVPGITHEGCGWHGHLIGGPFSSNCLKFVPSLSWQLIILLSKNSIKSAVFPDFFFSAGPSVETMSVTSLKRLPSALTMTLPRMIRGSRMIRMIRDRDAWTGSPSGSFRSVWMTPMAFAPNRSFCQDRLRPNAHAAN
jgi:hypothetical protein